MRLNDIARTLPSGSTACNLVHMVAAADSIVGPAICHSVWEDIIAQLEDREGRSDWTQRSHRISSNKEQDPARNPHSPIRSPVLWKCICCPQLVYILPIIPNSPSATLTHRQSVSRKYCARMSTPNGNIWAGSGSPKAMQVIDRFYSLLDAETPEAAKEMSQMCTEDAVFITPGQTFKGRQGN